MSSVNCYFLTKEHKDTRGYWNSGFDRNNSYVLLFLCLQIIKTCLSKNCFLGDKRTKRQKRGMGMGGLVETNLLFFCSYVLK